MILSEIFEPVHGDLLLVKAEMDKIVNEIENLPARIVFEHYFKTPGKLLRPSLLLLSAAVADKEGYIAAKSKLIKAAAAIELVHNASLIHDDIVDHEMLRRGQKTLNTAFGSKIAVLAGNALFIRAVSTLLDGISKEIAVKVIQMIRKMSIAEIRQLNRPNGPGSLEDYIELIEGKTALLMSNSCLLGAAVVTSDKGKTSALQQFGMNFGMSYQIVDDAIDQDPFAVRYVGFGDARKYAGIAVASLEDFGESNPKTALVEMIEYILSLTHIQVETGMSSEKNKSGNGGE